MKISCTMDTRGFLNSVHDKLNEEMMNFYLSHHDQSEVFNHPYVTMSKLMQELGDDPSGFVDALKKNVQKMLSLTFDYSEVEVELVSSENESVTKIQLSAIVRESGKNYQLNNVLLGHGSSFIEVLNGDGRKLVTLE